MRTHPSAGRLPRPGEFQGTDVCDEVVCTFCRHGDFVFFTPRVRMIYGYIPCGLGVDVVFSS